MYRVVFADDVKEDLAALGSHLRRRKVVAAIQCLPLNLDNRGVGEVVDAGGRVHRIGVTGGVAFVFRVDHALRQIQILAIESVEEE